jgi:hypothetical protein
MLASGPCSPTAIPPASPIRMIRTVDSMLISFVKFDLGMILDFQLINVVARAEPEAISRLTRCLLAIGQNRLFGDYFVVTWSRYVA